MNEAPVASQAPTSEGDFSAAVEALSASFGDPSRRQLYLFLRAHPHSSVAELAQAVDLHPNVVRHHLDRLVAAGHVNIEAPVRTAGAGRPAKRYSAVGDELTMEIGSRRDDLLVALLERSLELLGPEAAEAMAAQVGQEYGRALAERMGPSDTNRSVATAMGSIAQTLTAHGFKAHAEFGVDGHSVVADHCPFGEAAEHHPVLCAVDRGMVAGLLEGLGVGDGSTPVMLSSKARGDLDCRASA